MKKKLFVLLLSIISVVCLAFGVSACSKTKTDDVAVTSVSISTTEISLEVGESYTLSATILPSNATNTSVTWSSSATSVATVSGGKVTAISEGTAIITVTTTNGGYTDTCTVTVTETQNTPSTVSVTSVSLNETSLSLEAGGTYTLTATVLPSDATDKTVSWSSSDESVATVNNGVITAVAAGTATITVTTTDGNYTATCELTITEEPATFAVTSVTLDKTILSLTVDDTYTLTATISPNNATNQNITWSTSDNTVATISNGLVTAISVGTATITVTTEDGNYTDTCTVTVEEKSTHIHNYTSVVTDPTCTEQGYTTYTCECGDSYTDDYIDAIGHTNAEAVTENYVAATCTADGSYDLVVYCSVCGAEISRETITIPATGHTNAEAITENYVAATCTADGSYDLVVYCSVCGAEISRDTITIPATGHTNAEAVTENYVAATCTADGSYDLVVYCSVCGVEISRETSTIPATNHDYVATVTESTCTEQGYTTHTCLVCGDSYTDNETEALGHNYELSSWAWDGYTSATATFTCANDKSHVESVTATITDEIITMPTCTETGIKTYTATVTFDGKIYSDTTTEVIAATEHTEAEAVTENYVVATCTKDGSYDLVVYCSVCDAEISREIITIPATEHSYESVVTAPTCTESGYTTHTCSVCGDTYTDSETQATGHSWNEGEVTTEPTCTETGVKTYTCTTCGETKTETIAATGHTESEAVQENYVAATCTEDGTYDLVVYCSVCGAEISRETITIPATGHSYESVVTDPTCTEQGYTTHTCSVCGDTYTDSETQATGHSWNEGEVTTEPTCTDTGVKTYACTVCGETKTETIAAKGHTESESVKEKEVDATCTTNGSYDLVVYCSVCGAELNRETITIPATGHTASEAVTENYVAATCTTNGSYDLVVYCSVCGAELSRETITIPATGHTEAEAVMENYVAETDTENGSYDLVVYCSVCGEEISRETVVIYAILVTLSDTAIEIEKGDTYTLTATVTSNGVTSTDVTWSSSNNKVVTVVNGELTAVSTGTATITATSSDGNHTATCIITVTAVKAEITNVDGGTIDGTSIYMFVDSSINKMNLSSLVTCSNNCGWELYESDGKSNIATGIIASLADGNNTYYILVTSSKDSTVKSTYELTVYKSFEITISYYNGNSVINTDTAYTGYEFTTNYTPEITGYTFNNWAYSDGTAFSSETLWADLSLYADTTANIYTVIYDTDYGYMDDNQITVTYDSSYTFAVPERIGYTFNGWYYGETQLTYENGESLSIWRYTENIIATAKWTANEYVITLVLSDSKAGTVTGGGSHAFDSEVTISATTNAGYTWGGWYLNGELATAETTLTFTMEFAATYTATWTANKYEVTLELSDSNAGSVSGEGSHTYNTQITISATTNEGYTWVGWYLNGELASEEIEYKFTMGFAVTYTATWTANNYTVTLALSDNNAGTVSGACSYTYNTQVTISATTNDGYTWAGWYSNGVLVSSDIEYTFTMGLDVTYTAIWTANDYTVTLVLSDSNAGTVTGGGSYDYNSEVTISASTNTGYTWVGWYDLSGEPVTTNTSYTFTMSFGTTYTAVWTANDYEVTLKISDDSAGSVTGDGTYTYNTSVTISATTNSGYTWVGWYDSTGNFVTDEIEYTFTMGLDCLYTAAYSKINVTIAYSDAGTITSLDSTYTVGESVKITASEANLGYTWVGWYDKNGKLLTNDYTYSFDMPSVSNTYTATYTLNSEMANFNFTSTTTTCTITGIVDSSVTNIVIPDYVTAIAGSAFSGCDSLTSITIGSGVTSIGTYAFENCTADIIWSDNATITKIGSYAFANYTGASISIPDSVTSIGTYAFYCCASEVIWGNNIAITEIGSYAFAYYAGASIIIPDSVTTIGDYAFRYCTSLTSVYYSGTVSQWANTSFSDCYSNPLYYAGNLYINNILLTDLKDTDITSISAYAFVGWNVSTITIPDSVTSIGESAFGGCSSLVSITLPFVGSSASATSASASTLFGYIFGTISTGGTSTKQYYSSLSYKTYYVPTTLTTVTITGDKILYGSFYNCTKLTSINLDDRVTSIGSYVFYGCTALTNITIPDSVTFIVSYMFYGCTSLTSVIV